MKRASWLLVVASLAGCLEPGDFSNSSEIYEAIAARDSGTPEGGMGGSGGGGSGGMGGMGGGGGGTGGGDASMTGACGDVLEELLRPSCASTFCHSSTNTGPVDLEADDVGMRLIGKAGSEPDCVDYVYINAGNPAESLLYTKLNEDPPCGAQMPFSGDKFTDDQKACVLEYIEQVIAEQ